MTKQQIQKEREKLSFEVIHNKPKIDGLYPLNIIKTRELLLIAETELAKIGTGKNKKFHTEIYQKIMGFYHH